MSELSDDLKKICEIVGEGNYSTDPMDILCYSRDLAPVPEEMLKGYGMIEPSLIVKPQNIEQVASILKYAREKDIIITPRGGGSFALGGTIPMEGGVVVDLCAMNEIVDFNETDEYIRVQCGMSWRRLVEWLEPRGWTVGANASSGTSATIGGYIGTGGGAGIGVPKHGPLGNQIISMKVVLPNGDIIETNPWNSWTFIGAEGTLGIVCEVTLKVFRLQEQRFYMYGFDTLFDGIRALRRIAALKPYFLHFFDRGGINFLRRAGEEELREAAVTLVVLMRGSAAEVDAADKMLNDICRGAYRYPEDAVLEEWEGRYKVELRFKRLGPTLMLQEIRLPMSRLEAALEDLSKALKKEDWGIQSLSSDQENICLLVYALSDERDKLRFLKSLSLARTIPGVGYKHGGTVYGIGLHNSAHLTRLHGHRAVAFMKRMKAQFDPNAILNPSKTVVKRIPGFVVEGAMLTMQQAPWLMRLGLGIAAQIPQGLIRMGLKVVGGKLR